MKPMIGYTYHMILGTVEAVLVIPPLLFFILFAVKLHEEYE
jgi:hypothetical protein